MKKVIKFAFLTISIIVIGLGIVAYYFYWQMGQPVYKFGTVSSEENLRSPLVPPEQLDTSVLRVESDIDLYFEVYGKGRPIVIVHGGPGIPYSNAWKGLKSLEDRYSFYYYHQRGAGNSTRPIDRFESKNYPKNVKQLTQTLGVGAQIADIERIRRILKQDKLLLVGHSFGGFIAALYAAEFPEYVEKLILVGPAGMLTPPHSGNNIFELVRSRLPVEEQPTYDSLVKEYFNFGDIFSKSDSDLVDIHRKIGRYLLIGMGYDINNLDAPPTPGGWSSYAVYFSIGRSPNYSKAVANIIAPTLILHGENDDLTMNGSQEYEEYIPNSKFIVIGCFDDTVHSGHFVFNDCPEEFPTAVTQFLE